MKGRPGRPSLPPWRAAWLSFSCSSSPRASPGCWPCPPRTARRDASKGPRGRTPLESGRREAKQILFGDLHVHTTFSIDALVYGTALLSGEGSHPPADACDYARWCSAVDFFSINDHAEGLTPARWEETKQSIRQCNEVAGDPASPDLVAFLGFEWTQVGKTPETHYGHRNVIFRGLADDEVAARPITALPDGTTGRARAMGLARAVERIGRGVLGGAGEFLWLVSEMMGVPDCPRDVPPGELPADCRENAATPAELYARLARLRRRRARDPPRPRLGRARAAGREPRQLARGRAARPAARAAPRDLLGPRKQRGVPRSAGLRDGRRRRGAAARRRRATTSPAAGRRARSCAPAAATRRPAECEARVEEARRLALEAGAESRRTLPDAPLEAWLDCDQCRDCFKPAMSLRPRQTAQYALVATRPRSGSAATRPSACASASSRRPTRTARASPPASSSATASATRTRRATRARASSAGSTPGWSGARPIPCAPSRCPTSRKASAGSSPSTARRASCTRAAPSRCTRRAGAATRSSPPSPAARPTAPAARASCSGSIS